MLKLLYYILGATFFFRFSAIFVFGREDLIAFFGSSLMANLVVYGISFLLACAVYIPFWRSEQKEKAAR